MIIFDEIILNNFGTYKGASVIHLSTDPAKPVILVGGENGCGKTTLLDAFQLVLFGQSARCSNRGKLPYEVYLDRCINRDAPAEEGAGIKLTFQLFDGGKKRRFWIERKWHHKGKRVNECFTVYQWNKGNWKYDSVLANSWNDYIESFFPSQVAPFFFFDGEKIEALADFENSAPLIHSAIHSLLGLSLVGQLNTDLLALEKRKARELIGHEDKQVLDRLEDEIRGANERLVELNNLFTELSSELEIKKKTLSEVDLLFKQSGGELYLQRRDLEIQLAEHRNRLVENEEYLRSLASGAPPLLLVRSLLDEVRKQSNAEAISKREALLHATLQERDAALCALLEGIINDSTVVREISSFLENDRADRLNSTHIECYLGLNETASKTLMELLDRGLDETEEQISSGIKLTSSERERIDELERSLAGVPDETRITEIIEKRELCLDEAYNSEQKLNSIVEELERTKRQREQKTNELRRELERTAELRFEGRDSRRTLQYVAKVRSTLEVFRDKVLTKHLERIETLVLQCFRNILRKNTLIGDIKISRDTCEMKIFSTQGEELQPERLSAGERQLLATALLWGICQAAGKPLPTIIDTPLGRLDTTHRTNLINNYFPHASHQVLLLSTNEEIVGKYYDQLKPYVSRTCLLAHSEHQGGTTIKHEYFC